jgi:uncharacterized protein YcbK (DUF882 family)
MMGADGTVSPVYQELLRGYEQVRTAIGKPITINSGYRCPAYNASIKGAPLSAHTFGLALDISLGQQTTPDAIRAIVDSVNTLIPHFRMGVYTNFVHIDTAYVISPRMTAAWVRGMRWAGKSE